MNKAQQARAINKGLILQAITDGITSPSEIVLATGLSSATVYRYLRELLATGELVNQRGSYSLATEEPQDSPTVEIVEEEEPTAEPQEIEESSVQTFIYKAMGSVRAVLVDGEPWFVLKDVCDVLLLGNSRVVAARLDSDEKGYGLIDTLGGEQRLTLINESGLFTAIIRSNKPEARAFRKWITAEVLPAIRQTGTYSIPNPQPEPEPQIPLTQLEMLALSVKVLQEQETRLNVIENQVNQIVSKHAQALSELNKLPPAKLEAAPKTTRAMINEWVARYCQATEVAYSDAHRKLHSEFFYRYHINLNERFMNNRNKYASKLDIVEELGMLEQYYAICNEVLVIK